MGKINNKMELVRSDIELAVRLIDDAHLALKRAYLDTFRVTNIRRDNPYGNEDIQIRERIRNMCADSMKDLVELRQVVAIYPNMYLLSEISDSKGGDSE